MLYPWSATKYPKHDTSPPGCLPHTKFSDKVERATRCDLNGPRNHGSRHNRSRKEQIDHLGQAA